MDGYLWRAFQPPGMQWGRREPRCIRGLASTRSVDTAPRMVVRQCGLTAMSAALGHAGFAPSLLSSHICRDTIPFLKD